jgi:flagellar hook-length control protein FliK
MARFSMRAIAIGSPTGTPTQRGPAGRDMSAGPIGFAATFAATKAAHEAAPDHPPPPSGEQPPRQIAREQSASGITVDARAVVAAAGNPRDPAAAAGSTVPIGIPADPEDGVASKTDADQAGQGRPVAGPAPQDGVAAATGARSRPAGAANPPAAAAVPVTVETGAAPQEAHSALLEQLAAIAGRPAPAWATQQSSPAHARKTAPQSAAGAGGMPASHPAAHPSGAAQPATPSAPVAAALGRRDGMIVAAGLPTGKRSASLSAQNREKVGTTAPTHTLPSFAPLAAGTHSDTATSSALPAGNRPASLSAHNRAAVGATTPAHNLPPLAPLAAGIHSDTATSSALPAGNRPASLPAQNRAAVGVTAPAHNPPPLAPLAARAHSDTANSSADANPAEQSAAAPNTGATDIGTSGQASPASGASAADGSKSGNTRLADRVAAAAGSPISPPPNPAPAIAMAKGESRLSPPAAGVAVANHALPRRAEPAGFFAGQAIDAPNPPATAAGGAARPENAAAAPDSAPSGLAEQLSNQIIGSAAAGHQDFALRLHPSGLGEVSVRILVTGHDVSAWFDSPQLPVQQAISQSMGQLHADLASAGYDLSGAWVGGRTWTPRQRTGSSAPPRQGRGAAHSRPTEPSAPITTGVSIYV